MIKQKRLSKKKLKRVLRGKQNFYSIKKKINLKKSTMQD